jgi:hypothetical protein
MQLLISFITIKRLTFSYQTSDSDSVTATEAVRCTVPIPPMEALRKMKAPELKRLCESLNIPIARSKIEMIGLISSIAFAGEQ